MTSLVSRLAHSLRDIRLPFPMTQATATPSFSAIADPATGTVDVSGIIYKLESLCESYERVLAQATEQLESLEVPPAQLQRIESNAARSARSAVLDAANSGALMNSELRAHVCDYLESYLDSRSDFIDETVQRYIEQRGRDFIRDGALEFLREQEDQHVSRINERLEAKFRELNTALEELWGKRLSRLVDDRRALKESLLTLMGDNMRDLAREILNDTNNQPSL